VTNDLALAVATNWCQGVYGTFEAVECHGSSRLHHLECLVIIVAAHIASGHACFSNLGMPIVDRSVIARTNASLSSNDYGLTSGFQFKPTASTG
jgi:hypothetical protein